VRALLKRSILIANRGEIAIRIARTIRELGWIAIGIYTDADKLSLHRKYMDYDSKVSSYLDMDEIIDVALELGVDGIHPGYGFLSENSSFAEKVIRAGLTFIGPPPRAMKLSGDKVMAKDIAMELGISTIPWMEVRDPLNIIDYAREYGYPVLIKATGGGGGIGMRVIRSDDEAEAYFKQAKREAEKAFNDPRIFVEKYLSDVKHIEVQILSDGDKVVHLFDRDCSIQRRYQKVIEEAPSPALGSGDREKILSDAIELMKSIKYINAGTVEFLYDVRNKKHYFMEINARLQVEHPVTEMITGVDIVRQQLLIAFEEGVELSQGDVSIRGHAVEARINAENPITLMPSPGVVKKYFEPSGPGIRVDSGISEGSIVSTEYSPLMAKLIAWAPTRESAIRKLARALSEYIITGVDTNIPVLKSIILSEEFLKGSHTTSFLDTHVDSIKRKLVELEKIHAVAVSMLMTKSIDGLGALLHKVKKIGGKVGSLKRSAWMYWSIVKSRVKREKKLKRLPRSSK